MYTPLFPPQSGVLVWSGMGQGEEKSLSVEVSSEGDSDPPSVLLPHREADAPLRRDEHSVTDRVRIPYHHRRYACRVRGLQSATPSHSQTHGRATQRYGALRLCLSTRLLSQACSLPVVGPAEVWSVLAMRGFEE